VRLCVGDDWAQDHHEVEVMDEASAVLASWRLTEGVGRDRAAARADRPVRSRTDGAAQVRAGIETVRGLWVAALIAAGMWCSR